MTNLHFRTNLNITAIYYSKTVGILRFKSYLMFSEYLPNIYRVWTTEKLDLQSKHNKNYIVELLRTLDLGYLWSVLNDFQFHLINIIGQYIYKVTWKYESIASNVRSNIFFLKKYVAILRRLLIVQLFTNNHASRIM